MNVIFCLFKKDLSCLKIALIVWLLLIACQSALGVGGSKISAEILEFQMFLPVLSILLSFLQGMMVLVMVPLIIQGDSIVGTTAFWFTRPISRKALLTTKATFIATILVAMPLLAEVFVLAANGVMANHIFLAAPEILIEKTAFVMPFFLLSVLTPKFSRYALVGITVFVALVVLKIIIGVVLMIVPALSAVLLTPFHNHAFHEKPSLNTSFKVAQDCYIIFVGLLLIIHQFTTRYSERTIRWFVVACLFLMCLSKLWSWDFLNETADAKLEASITDSLQLEFDMNHVTMNDRLRYRMQDAREKSITIKAFAKGLPENQFANLRELEHVRVEYPDGSAIKSGFVWVEKMESSSDEKLMPALQSALGNIKIVNSLYGKFTPTEVMSLEDGSFDAYKGRAGAYMASATFDVYEYKEVAEVPLTQGAEVAFSSQQVIVYDVLEVAHGILVIVGEKKANLLFDRATTWESEDDKALDLFSGEYKSVYLIVNRKEREAFLAEFEGDLRFDAMSFLVSTRLETKAKQVDFTYVNDRNTALPKIDKEWLADATLVRLDAVKLGTRKINVRIDNFVIPTQSTPTTEMDALNQQMRETVKQQKTQLSH